MSQQSRLFFLLFFITITICDISASLAGYESLRWFFKPAVMISLILYYCIHTLVASKFDRWIIAGFALAFYGDVLLIKSDLENFFILGILMFTFCHVFYIRAFIPEKYTFQRFLANFKEYWWVQVLLLLLGGVVYALIYPEIGFILRFAVAFYIFIILSMSSLAIIRKEYCTPRSYYCGVIGSVIFMASDAILAINAFSTEIPYGKALIMSTYAIAQYILALSFIEESKLRYRSLIDTDTSVDKLFLGTNN